MRRRFCGRQPLCGTGVTSEIELMRMPSEARARTDDSRPGPGPLMRTSRFLMPWSCAARPATSAATWAANGVLFRDRESSHRRFTARARALDAHIEILDALVLRGAAGHFGRHLGCEWRALA